MKNKSCLLIILALVCFSSCIEPEKVELGEIQSISYHGVKGNKIRMELEIPVENGSIYKVKVDEINADIKLNHMPFGKLKKVNEVSIPGHFKGTNKVLIDAEITNVAGGLVAIIQMFSRSKISYEINGDIKLKMFLFSKTVPFNKKGRVNLKKKKGKNTIAPV